MSKQNLVSKAVRLALVVGAAGLGANAALADDTTSTTTTTTTSDTSSTNLGKIEVTGSRIKRTDVETAQPIAIVTAAQIKQTGLATIGAVIQKLTSSGSSLSTLDNFGGNFTFTGGGQSTVDLRNLDAKRVLVLVNGKRWVTGLDGTVDLNTIPSSVIDHVEVLQDGASAIYGSDAIAGVVNIITVKNYNGSEANAYMGMYNGDSHWDGKTQSYDFTMGSSNDKSGLVFNASYTNQDGILSKDRDISKEPVIGLGNSGGSSAIPNGRFVFVPPSTSPWFAFCGGTCDLTIKDGATPGKNGKLNMNDFRPFVSSGPASDRFNYAPYNYVLTPEERYSGYVQGYTDLADNITFKADMMYSHRDSHQQSAPEPLFFASSSIAIDIPASQKYNPFGFDLNAADPANANLFLFGRRMVENGPRLYHEKEDTFHIDMGFTGFFNMGGKEWDWDANYAFSKDSEVDINDGHFDVSHLRLALGDAALCAQVQGCVQLNIFGGANPGAVTQPMLDYIKYTAQNQFENNQRIYNLDLTQGDLFELPGGSAGLALGFEQLEHDGFFLPDSVAQNGYDSFNPGRPVLPTTGRESSQAEYAELDLPLFGGVPGVKLLDLDLAGRHTKYDVYGTSNTYRYGLKYQPTDELMFRTSWSQGFRAPSIQELFSAGTNFSANIVDPCDTPASSSVCAAQGIPSTYTQPNAQINTLEIGNRNLRPETSVSRTLGFVYNPDWAAGLSLNMDYYKIEVDNIIQPFSGQTILDNCYTANAADSDPAACGLITRTAFGAVQTLKDQIVNAGTLNTSGIDVNITYALPSSAAGDFKVTFDETHIRVYQQVIINTATGQPITTDLAGVERGGSVFPFGVPRDKARLALDWAAGGWSAEYALRYVRSMVEENNGTPTGVHIGATVYHDVQASYDWDATKTTFTLGVRNLFAKNPPSSTVQELNNFDPALYDVPGRFVYGRIGVKF